MRILICGEGRKNPLKDIIRVLGDSNKERNAICPCCGSQLAWNVGDVHFTENREKQYICCPFDGEQIYVDNCITK